MLKELRSQHRNIIQMSFNGYSNNEIAERLGMAHTTVSTILRSPLGQAYLNGLQDRAHEATLDVRKKLVSLNKAALETFTRLLDPKEKKVPHSVQFNAAKDVLDRNGYKAPDRLNIDMTLQTKTDEELDAEIAAIEASIKRTTGIRNLPEIKPSSLQPAPTNITSSKGDKFVVVPSIPSAPCSPALFVDASEEALSLEDFPTDEHYNLEDLNNFAEESSLEEPPLVEDPSILEDLSFDPFHNIKRS
jgi:predicted transcriptional regulator